MKRGLSFGKFMPLHRGHELLIDTALSQCDELTILVYDSVPPGSYPAMPIELRLGWLRTLYPQVENILAVPDLRDGEGDSDDPRYAKEYADAIGFLGRFDVVFTSEPGYDDFAAALGASNVIVDTERTLLPISGSQIRADVFEHRAWMDPRVYSSLIQKVVFVGTESSGKTTLARACAEAFDTLWVHEFGRELWVEQGLTGTFADHLKMGRVQYERERHAARHSRDFLFCDTNAWTTLQWALRSYGTADVRLRDLVDSTMDEYAWFLCENDFGWVDDGVREMPGGLAGEFQQALRAVLDRRGVYYTTLRGPTHERLYDVRNVLGLLWNKRTKFGTFDRPESERT